MAAGDGGGAPATAPDGVRLDAPSTYQTVSNYYGEVLTSSKDLKTSACCAAGAPHPRIRAILAALPEEVVSRFYGCGAPLPLGITGCRVLDLGWCVARVVRVARARASSVQGLL